MRPTLAVLLIASIILTGDAADGKKGAEGADKAVRLVLVAAPKPGQPWVAATEKTVRELFGPGETPPKLQLRVEGVKLSGAKGATLALVANTINLTEKDVPKNPALIDYLSPYPVDGKPHSFDADATETIARLAKAGELRGDRPLVFAFLVVPLSESGNFEPGDWSIAGVSLRVGGR